MTLCNNPQLIKMYTKMLASHDSSTVNLTSAVIAPLTFNTSFDNDSKSDKKRLSAIAVGTILRDNPLLRKIVAHAIARDFMYGKVAWFGLIRTDYLLFMANNHPLFSIIFVHSCHRYSRIYRILMLIFTFAIITIPYKWVNQLFDNGTLQSQSPLAAFAFLYSLIWSLFQIVLIYTLQSGYILSRNCFCAYLLVFLTICLLVVAILYLNFAPSAIAIILISILAWFIIDPILYTILFLFAYFRQLNMDIDTAEQDYVISFQEYLAFLEQGKKMEDWKVEATLNDILVTELHRYANRNSHYDQEYDPNNPITKPRPGRVRVPSATSSRSGSPHRHHRYHSSHASSRNSSHGSHGSHGSSHSKRSKKRRHKRYSGTVSSNDTVRYMGNGSSFIAPSDVTPMGADNPNYMGHGNTPSAQYYYHPSGMVFPVTTATPAVVQMAPQQPQRLYSVSGPAVEMIPHQQTASLLHNPMQMGGPSIDYRMVGATSNDTLSPNIDTISVLSPATRKQSRQSNFTMITHHISDSDGSDSNPTPTIDVVMDPQRAALGLNASGARAYPDHEDHDPDFMQPQKSSKSRRRAKKDHTPPPKSKRKPSQLSANIEKGELKPRDIYGRNSGPAPTIIIQDEISPKRGNDYSDSDSEHPSESLNL